jgi:hypothetical protein
MTLTYPQDIFGQRTGTFAQWPSQNWTGWNVYWSQVAGQRLNMGGADAYIDHSDAVGSTTMETDPAGAVRCGGNSTSRSGSFGHAKRREPHRQFPTDHLESASRCRACPLRPGTRLRFLRCGSR